jgi:DUF4097 and DUF4098 domain-containing protein YvlB
MRTLIFALATLAAASTAHAGWFDACDESAPRNAASSAAGVTRIVIVGRAGFLHIEGRNGASEVRAEGTACASERDMLRDVTLTMTRNGSELRVEANIPEHDGHGFFYSSPQLDFTVTLPSGVPIDVKDSSGDLTIRNVGDATVDDSSGGIEIRGIHGNLTLRDSSGDIDIEDVSGDVRIPEDGSGCIDIARVGGSVTIDEDGSGSIDIREVKRNVLIGNDGSGSIDVNDVGGDFSVRSKSSGGVSYDRVSGRVDVPRRR